MTFDFFSSSPRKCYMRIDKQIIKLVYNDVKNVNVNVWAAAEVSKVFLYLCVIITFAYNST